MRILSKRLTTSNAAKLVLHLEKNGRSYLERTPGDAGLHSGDQFTTASPKIEIEVQSIDPDAQRAVVRLTVIR